MVIYAAKELMYMLRLIGFQGIFVDAFARNVAAFVFVNIVITKTAHRKRKQYGRD